MVSTLRHQIGVLEFSLQFLSSICLYLPPFHLRLSDKRMRRIGRIVRSNINPFRSLRGFASTVLVVVLGLVALSFRGLTL
jgi:hypothetical protein